MTDKLQILCLEPSRYSDSARALLESLGRVDYADIESQQEFHSRVSADTYNVIIVRLGLAVNAAILDASPALRVVVTPTTGTDHIDEADCDNRGVAVISLRGETEFLESIRSTAEHTWAILLSLVRRIPESTQDVAAGNWRRKQFLAEELHTKTLGIVGLGRLGKMVAQYGVAFGMRVLATDLNGAGKENVPSGVELISVENLLSRADVLSLHLPLNQSTQGWLSANRLATLKKGSVVVNTARGELIDEPALLTALISGHIAGAALDVLSGDGVWDGRIPEFHPLVQHSIKYGNLIVTPHVGGYSRYAVEGTGLFTAKKLISVCSNL